MHRPIDRRTRIAKQLATVLTIFALSACREPATPDAQAVRAALDGHRRALPALSGIEQNPDCRLVPGFVPAMHCDSEWTSDEAMTIGKLSRVFKGRLTAQPTTAELHGAALLRLAVDPDAKNIRVAIGNLQEALGRESAPLPRAELLSDLAGAYLMLATSLQSSLEVAAALERALEALELAPDNSNADFNSRLALLLLGIESPKSFASRPELAEVATHLRRAREEAGSPGTEPSPSPESGCLSAQDLRVALDAWVDQRDPATWSPLARELGCSQNAADRFFPEMLTAAAESPERLATSWQHYRDIEAAFGAFDPARIQHHLATLEEDRPPVAVALAADYFAAMLPFQEGRYDEVQARLERHKAEVEARDYIGLTAKALIGLALVAQLRGEYGSALLWQQEAEIVARSSGVEALISKARVQRAELEVLGGREYDAWRSQTLALRELGAAPESEPLVNALEIAADLASQRGFERVALVLQDRAVAVATKLGTGTRIAALRSRGETRARLGRIEAARRDLTSGQRLLGESAELLARENLQADLDYLAGLVAADAATRSKSLQATLERYQAIGYDRRILGVQHALATTQRDRGDREAAMSTLSSAFDDLAAQVQGAATWRDATALVASARPIVDTLIGLQLESSRPDEVLETIGRYLGLRSNRADGIARRGPVAGLRLTSFVRSDELVLLLESDEGLEIRRQTVDRDRLADLRDRVLIQASTLTNAARFQATLEPLGELILRPFTSHLTNEESLVIVADDVLAGLPFHLLPIADTGELLIDRVIVSYATDLREQPRQSDPEHLLALGSSGQGSDFPELPGAEGEALDVASVYSQGVSLVGTAATPAAVRSRLGDDSSTWDAVHVASHFEANPRWPLQSFLVLDPGQGATTDRHLTLRELLAHTPEGLELLYLSACDTGIGLPTEAHGLHSLAQAFTATGIRHTVLTLWRLEDETGAAIARRFHRLVAAGSPVAEALRAAQLEHRGEHPAIWGALAAYH